MTLDPETIRQIVDERLAEWREVLIRHGATPFMLFGLQATSSIPVVCMPDFMKGSEAARILRAAADAVEMQAQQN